ncbi:MAG TPA: DegT/DnrJ/EryC1/StrS family aminotransferase, partial [Chthoniobacteraceae bacterium]|nr:DegT/DnrJ/EryC1/StrS family aminotransferase [Chthoniobacteraceae bacterium]
DMEKIQTRPLWQPMHRSPAHAGSESVGGEVADALHSECLSLPCSVGISAGERERVVGEIQRAQRAGIQNKCLSS